MSDFAVGFYNIIYEDILGKTGLLKDNSFSNCDFAGDTMNSFNSIANIVPEAGKSKKTRTEIEKWPDFLQEYYRRYHCLANFWILPMKIGRKDSKFNRYDSLDIFLNSIQQSFDSQLKDYPDYFNQMNNYNTFCKKHFIWDYSLLDKIEDKYCNGQAQDLINQAYHCMKCRANNILSNELIVEKLYNYFNKVIV